MGSNMAEAHPVGFQWVMEAKARGAKVIHIDPRFTRTSALADTYVPDPGGQRHRLPRRRDQLHPEQRAGLPRVRRGVHERGRADLATEFRDTEDLDGLFCGYDAGHGDATTAAAGSTRARTRSTPTTGDSTEHKEQTRSTAAGAGGAPLERRRGRRHRGPDPAAPATASTRSSSGTSPATPRRWSSRSAACRRSSSARSARPGRRTPAASAPPRWSTASAGPSTASARSTSAPASIIQLLLGNIGRPGGGDLRAARARQHPGLAPTSRRCSTCCPATCRCPAREPPDDLDAYLDADPQPQAEGLLVRRRRLHGLAAQGVLGRARHRRERLRLRLPAADQRRPRHVPHGHGHGRRRRSPATSCSARTRRSARSHGRLQRLAHGQPRLAGRPRPRDDRERHVLEGRAGGRDRRDRPEECRTEVFFFPAASHVEKEGTFTQTQRMLQWREKAVEPTGDQRSDLWFFYHLGRMVKERLADSTDERDRPMQKLELGLPRARRSRAEASRTPRRCCGGSTATTSPPASPSTATASSRPTAPPPCGCWIYSGVYADGVNQAARRKPHGEQGPYDARVGLGVAAEPARALQPGLGRPGRQAVERAQEARLVGRRQGRVDGRRRPGLPDDQAARPRPGPPDAVGPGGAARRRPVRHAGRRQGLAVRAQRRCWTGRCRRTTSPHESPVRNPLLRPAGQPDPQGLRARGQPVEPDPAGAAAAEVFPFVLTTSPAHRAPHGGRR